MSISLITLDNKLDNLDISLNSLTTSLNTLEDSIDVSFTSYSYGTILTADTSGNFVRADGDLTLPSAIAGRHLTILAGEEISDFSAIQTIVGGYTNEWVGFSSCISADGSVFAYGAYRSKPNNITSAGYTKIYRKDSNGVYQEEQTIEGIYTLQQAGSRVDINGAGTRIAINSRGWSNNNTQPVLPANLEHGFVDIYDYSNGTWSKTFTAETTTQGNSAMGVSLSKDGNTLIISKLHDNNSRGYAKVYYYDGSNWSQKGATLTGSASQEWFGFDVDVNADGTRIAIGQARYTSNNTGRVQVFTFNGSAWVQYGNDMASAIGDTGEEFGRVIKFNETGTRIIIGSPRKDTTNTDAGVVVVYEDQSGTWTQIGSSLSGKDSIDDLFGWIVDITDDGNTIIAGSRYNYEGNTSVRKPGYARFYKWNGSDWDLTQTINPPSGEVESATVHSLSRDGAYFVYGLPYHNTQTGKIILYKPEVYMMTSKIITPASSDYINGSTNSLTVNTLTTFACSKDGEWIAEVPTGFLNLTSTTNQTISGPITLEDDISLSTNSKIQLGTSYGTSGQVLTSGGSSGSLSWVTPSSGGGGGSSSITPYIFITKSNDQSVTSSANTFNNLLELNTVEITSTGAGAITLNTTTYPGRITINETGIYKLDAMLSADAGSSTRVIGIAQLKKNGTYLSPYECYAYCRTSATGENTASLTGILSLSSSDYLEIYISRNTNSSVKFTSKGTGISLMKIA